MSDPIVTAVAAVPAAAIVDVKSDIAIVKAEPAKVEGFFEKNEKAAVIGTAVAVALIAVALVHFL